MELKGQIRFSTISEKELSEKDKNWNEIITLAEKYGFLVDSYSGVATIATHKNQYEQFGEERYIEMQEEQRKSSKLR